ncbi:MFS transporter [Microbacterium sp. P04]|uniref:MFS transporter n=1 Tax=Microbacterium sp. P04 TaxID=3366947 RepID=UPI0037470F2E
MSHTPDPAPGSPAAPPPRISSLAPFAVPAFRMLWIAGLVSNIGSWMQSVGAQWFLVEADASPVIVALVQTASAAPVLLFAIPGGVMGEFLNRRRVLIGAQSLQLAAVGALTVLTIAGQTTPVLLLTLTFLLGIASAAQLPAYQAIVPDVVPRKMIRQAASLSSINVNVARAIGPAAAGLIVSSFGVGAVFLVNALSFVVFLATLLLWRGYRPPAVRPEPFFDATRAGLRYLQHSDIVRAIFFRLAVFLVPANALWALLPVIADDELNIGADGYGLLLGALGVGAVAGIFVLPPTQRRLGVNGLVSLSAIVYGAGLAALVLFPSLPIALAVLVLTGLAWIGVIATVNATVQAFLPTWVRTRGLSLYQVVLYGGTAFGAAITGALANIFGATLVMWVSGAAIVLIGVSLVIWPIPSTKGIGRAIVPMGDPKDRDPRDDDRPLLVLVQYTVAEDRRAEFLDAMSLVEQSRYRTGARTWRLYAHQTQPGVLIEAFTVGTWREHESATQDRVTEYDAQVLDKAKGLSTVTPTPQYLLDVPVHKHPTRPFTDVPPPEPR